jgi:hypothetical protein
MFHLYAQIDLLISAEIVADTSNSGNVPSEATYEGDISLYARSGILCAADLGGIPMVGRMVI